MTTYNKLIRDKIPEHLESKGVSYKAHIAGDQEYHEKLHEKLREEMEEFLKDENQEEMADVFEVITAILALHGWSLEEIVAIQQQKRDEKGAFEQRIILDES